LLVFKILKNVECNQCKVLSVFYQNLFSFYYIKLVTSTFKPVQSIIQNLIWNYFLSSSLPKAGPQVVGWIPAAAGCVSWPSSNSCFCGRSSSWTRSSSNTFSPCRQNIQSASPEFCSRVSWQLPQQGKLNKSLLCIEVVIRLQLFELFLNLK